jgi:hypothetical protein
MVELRDSSGIKPQRTQTARVLNNFGAAIPATSWDQKMEGKTGKNPYQENSFFFSRSHLPDAGG